MDSGANADALMALNALLSASTNNQCNAGPFSANSTDSLTNLLDTLANFSVRVNTNEGTSTSSSADDLANLLLAGLTNSKNDLDQGSSDDYERYEQSRDQKFRELEAKFGFLSPRKSKVEQKKQEQQQRLPIESNSASTQRAVDKPSFAVSAGSFINSTTIAELLSGLQKSQAEKAAAVSSTSKVTPKLAGHKRRARSATRSSSSGSSRSSSRSGSSYSESDRSAKARKKRAERKKKAKKLKTKKAKAVKALSASKQAKQKKDLLEAERKTVADQVSKLKAGLADYDKQRQTLEDELSRLKKQHNEMCRKLQRQKSDPRKDKLIIDNEALQSDIERTLRSKNEQKENDEKLLEAEEKKLEKLKKQKIVKKEETHSKKSVSASETSPAAKKPKEENVEYFDPGSHWCKSCSTVLTSVYDWFAHLHSQKHKASIPTLERPWMPEQVKNSLKSQGVAALKPFKGAEFFMPSTAFYCNLCKEFSGDSLSAEAHLKSSSHNAKYQDYVESNPFYERREMLEKAAAVSHRVDKSASESYSDEKKHRPSTDKDKPQPRANEPQRVPHRPNESGKIKPFHVSLSSAAKDAKDEKRTTSGFSMKVDVKKSSSSSSATVLKKPHSAFSDGGEKSKHNTSRHSERSSGSDRKRHHRDR